MGRRLLFVSPGALAVALFAAEGLAQRGPEEIVRRDLLAQAQQARVAEDHARAVELAQRAAAIRATPSVQYFLAREHEALGHALASLAEASACARGAEADPTVPNRLVLLRACRAIVVRTEVTIGRVTVRVASPPEGVSVRIAGDALAPALFGLPYPVPPGAVRVEASAPGFDAWQREVAVAAGASVDVDVSLSPTPPPPPPPPPPVVVAPPVAPPTATPVRPTRSAAPLIAGLSVAAAGFAAAGAFYAVAMGAQSDRDGACRGTPRSCDPGANADDARYRGFVYATDVALGFGAAAALTGALVWWFVRPSAGGPARPRVVVAPVAGRAAGAALVISM